MLERVLLGRHGTTNWNVAGRRQGRADIPLDQQGEEEAVRLGEFARRAGVDRVYCSPLVRCTGTSEIVSRSASIPFDIVDEFVELDLGWTTGLTWRELEHQYGGFLVQRRRNKLNIRWPAGESYADALVRVTLGLSKIASDSPSLPLIISHEMITKVVLLALCGIDSDPTLSRRLPHGCFYDVLPKGGEARLLYVEESLAS